MKCETTVFFYPQAIWVFMLLWLSLSEAMKAAGWLTSAGVVVTACDILCSPSFVSSFQTALLTFPRCVSIETLLVFPSPCDSNSLVSVFQRRTSMSPWASLSSASPLIDFSSIMKNEPGFQMAHLAQLLSQCLLLYLQHIKKG